MSTHDIHSDIMHRCVDTAWHYASSTQSNPMVGAAIAKNGEVLVYAAHETYGAEHAEVRALNALAAKGISPQGMDVYVTLEPCSTHGKTPPCTEALIAARVARVFIGVCDPTPQHAGHGVRALQEAGIVVHLGIAQDACAQLIEDFYVFTRFQRPYVSAKIAQSIDGRIATPTQESKWITSEASRLYARSLRGRCSAIITGVNTIIADDPQLNTRNTDVQTPHKIILDTHGRVPLSAKILNTPHEPVSIIGTTSFISPHPGVQHIMQNPYDIPAVLAQLAKHRFKHIFIESGPQVLSSFLQESLIDTLYVFIAPKIIGSEGLPSFHTLDYPSLQHVPKAKRISTSHIDDDVLITYAFHEYQRDIIRITKEIAAQCSLDL